MQQCKHDCETRANKYMLLSEFIQTFNERLSDSLNCVRSTGSFTPFSPVFQLYLDNGCISDCDKFCAMKHHFGLKGEDLMPLVEFRSVS